MTVLELNELVKAFEESLACRQLQWQSLARQAAARLLQQKKTEFTVVLAEAGSNKVAVIKAVRELTV